MAIPLGGVLEILLNVPVRGVFRSWAGGGVGRFMPLGGLSGIIPASSIVLAEQAKWASPPNKFTPESRQTRYPAPS
jgi:hypothetical protein